RQCPMPAKPRATTPRIAMRGADGSARAQGERSLRRAPAGGPRSGVLGHVVSRWGGSYLGSLPLTKYTIEPVGPGRMTVLLCDASVEPPDGCERRVGGRADRQCGDRSTALRDAGRRRERDKNRGGAGREKHCEINGSTAQRLHRRWAQLGQRPRLI